MREYLSGEDLNPAQSWMRGYSDQTRVAVHVDSTREAYVHGL